MGAEIKKERHKGTLNRELTRHTALWCYNSTGFGKVKSDLSDGADLWDGKQLKLVSWNNAGDDYGNTEWTLK